MPSSACKMKRPSAPTAAARTVGEESMVAIGKSRLSISTDSSAHAASIAASRS
ncbi:MAG: hypothetical protein D6749_03345 [Chloroflexota bacterium]|nr:MAG: hypothetical protein D6749_03345 [Chloroflexota bacterium]